MSRYIDYVDGDPDDIALVECASMVHVDTEDCDCYEAAVALKVAIKNGKWTFGEAHVLETALGLLQNKCGMENA
jgi:hypothetical protein